MPDGDASTNPTIYEGRGGSPMSYLQRKGGELTRPSPKKNLGKGRKKALRCLTVSKREKGLTRFVVSMGGKKGRRTSTPSFEKIAYYGRASDALSPCWEGEKSAFFLQKRKDSPQGWREKEKKGGANAEPGRGGPLFEKAAYLKRSTFLFTGGGREKKKYRNTNEWERR